MHFFLLSRLPASHQLISVDATGEQPDKMGIQVWPLAACLLCNLGRLSLISLGLSLLICKMEAGLAGKDGCVIHEGIVIVRDCYWLGSIFLWGVRMYMCVEVRGQP